MSGYYPPNPNVPPQYYNVNPTVVPHPNMATVPPMMVPDGGAYPPTHGLPESPMYRGMPGPFAPYGEPQMQQPFMGQYEDIPGPMDPSQAGNGRMRRRPAPSDHVKHRRTRSGCFTCRQRRVKCDETHPICERCRKGSRECVYPEPQSNQKSPRGGAKSGKSSSGDAESSPEHQGDESKEPLPAIVDEDEDEDVDTDYGSMSKSQDLRDTSETPSLTHDRSPSPSTEVSSVTTAPSVRPSLSRKGSAQTTKAAAPSKYTPVVPKDVQFYLNYFKTHISFHHYSFKHDNSNFLKTDFLDQAMKYEPLRYAIAGYAAYFHTINQPDGRISTFLHFYNESVSRLRVSITKNKNQSLATFLTILQLASIEEVLGDWVNLMSHQKAAFEMLTRLYTPKTILKSGFLLKILIWYIRFDMFVGFQSGGESVLSTEWYQSVCDHFAQKSKENPTSLTLKYDERFAHSRLVAKMSGDLFARKGKGQLSDEEFMENLPKVKTMVDELPDIIDPALLDPSSKVKDFPGKPDPDSIVNPHEPNVIWDGPQWTTNYLVFDMYGIVFMHNISTSMALRKPLDPILTEKAQYVAQLFEAVCAYPGAPPGAIIEAQVSFAIAIIFLPKDAKTIEWCRRTLARVESAGYIYSDAYRNRMLEMWGIGPSDWWLPNDEGCPPIIRSIKDFITERTTAPRDQTSEDLKEMKGIFSTLTISDSPSSDTASSGPGGSQSTQEDTMIYNGGSPDSDWSYDRKYAGTEAFGPGPFSGS